MKIANVHSHLYGLEFLVIRKPALWQEMQSIIAEVDSSQIATTEPTEFVAEEKLDQIKVTRQLSARLLANSWSESQGTHMAPSSDTRTTRNSDQNSQPTGIDSGMHACCRDEISFVKERVAIDMPFGRHPFAKHLLLYSGDVIDVGVEILPMKEMLQDAAGGRRMSTGIAYFEGEVYNILRHGRNSPPVPLLIIGIAP